MSLVPPWFSNSSQCRTKSVKRLRVTVGHQQLAIPSLTVPNLAASFSTTLFWLYHRVTELRSYCQLNQLANDDKTATDEE